MSLFERLFAKMYEPDPEEERLRESCRRTSAIIGQCRHMKHAEYDEEGNPYYTDVASCTPAYFEEMTLTAAGDLTDAELAVQAGKIDEYFDGHFDRKETLEELRSQGFKEVFIGTGEYKEVHLA